MVDYSTLYVHVHVPFLETQTNFVPLFPWSSKIHVANLEHKFVLLFLQYHIYVNKLSYTVYLMIFFFL